jgi:hypothetical protein
MASYKYYAAVNAALEDFPQLENPVRLILGVAKGRFLRPLIEKFGVEKKEVLDEGLVALYQAKEEGADMADIRELYRRIKNHLAGWLRRVYCRPYNREVIFSRIEAKADKKSKEGGEMNYQELIEDKNSITLEEEVQYRQAVNAVMAVIEASWPEPAGQNLRAMMARRQALGQYQLILYWLARGADIFWIAANVTANAPRVVVMVQHHLKNNPAFMRDYGWVVQPRMAA